MRWVLVCIIFCFGCQSEPSKQNVVKIAMIGDPVSVDPRIARSLGDKIIVSCLFEGLNELSSSIEELENRYIFHLKEQFWSNGDPILAEDFVQTWKTSLDPSFPSENAHLLFCIQNAQAIKAGEKTSSELGARSLDEKTLEIVLEKPTSHFLEIIHSTAFSAVHKNKNVFSGPFCIKQWKHNNCLDLKKNPHHPNKENLKIDLISFIVTNEDTAIKMFEKNEVDWAGSPLSSIPFDALSSLSRKQEFHKGPTFGTGFYRFNTELTPFNNKNIRKAFAFSINRQEIVNHIYQDAYDPAYGFIPTEMNVYSEKYFQESEVEAKKFLEKGLEELNIDLKDLPKMTLTYVSILRNHLIAQQIQQDWRRVLGILIELEPVEIQVYFSKLKKGNYQIASSSWIPDINDPLDFLEIFKEKSGSSNHTGWEHAEYRALLDQSLNIFEKNPILQQAEQILMDEMPIMPIYFLKMLYLKQKKTQGIDISPLGIFNFTDN